MPRHRRPTFSSASSEGTSSEGPSSRDSSLRDFSPNEDTPPDGSHGPWRGGASRPWKGLRAALPDRPLRAILVAGIVLVALALSLLWLAGSTRPERDPKLAVADSSQKREKQEKQGGKQTQPTEEKRKERSKKERSKEAQKATEEAPHEKPGARSSSDSSSKESSNESSSNESSSGGSSPSESSPEESSSGASGERTYSFAGSVSKDIPEVKDRSNASGGQSGSSSSSTSREGNSQGGKPGKGDSRSQQDGTVPELTIQVTGDNITAVADRFDYQMAAITGSGDALLGTVEGGTLRSLSEGELSRYAGRARSARQHPKYQELLHRVARQVPGQGAGSIRLIYLVPKAVENQFVRAQMRALDRKGLSPDEVAKMEARPKGQSIEITGITRK